MDQEQSPSMHYAPLEPSSQDTLFLRNILVRCIIGIHPYERDKRQNLLISVTLHFPLGQAGATDDISHSVDYSALESHIVETIEMSSFSVIEAVAEEVARICLRESRVHAVEVTVEKPQALTYAQSVGVTIHRTRRPVHG